MRLRTAMAVFAALGVTLAVAACGPSLSSDDRAALETLAVVAATTSTVDPELVDETECWVPSEHLGPVEETGNETTWKVLCRVHWTQSDGAERHQDTTCIGDFARDPMLENCYRWTYYDLGPAYEDHRGVIAG